MIFKDFQGKKLSALGLGCMRLPVIDGDTAKIDMQKSREMVDYAMKQGVNYYDTAWGYHNGQSELVMGELLKNYPRESFYLASKFPSYDLQFIDKAREIFPKQLEKCQVDYFDFYLCHNICEMNIDAYFDEKLGIVDYLKEEKAKGRIRHLGFSAHANLDTLQRFLEGYGKDMEFCQLQINWLDWEFQNAKQKVELVSSYGIPVWVMEPVRGGSLVKLAPEHEGRLQTLRPNVKTVEWAFRFLQSIPEVVVTLSGMSNMEQLQENIATYQTDAPLNERERSAILNVGRAMTGKNALPCTACRYCTDHCPMGLDIPWLIELYNEHVYSEGGFIAPMALSSLKEDELPSACVGCRACEGVCPQTIKISEMMSDFAEKLK